MSDELTTYLYDNFKMTLTMAQKEAVEALHGPTCVISCPGSGKTTVIVIRLANLIVKGGVLPHQILELYHKISYQFLHVFSYKVVLLRQYLIHKFFSHKQPPEIY